MSDLLNGFTEELLLEQLPTSVMGAIKSIPPEEATWDAIGMLLASAPTIGVSLKGGTGWSGKLWEGVKKEFHSFLCTDSTAYADLRKQWKDLQQKSATLAVSSHSVVIGAQLGVASGVITPLVIWAIVVGLRIGKEAVCQTLNTLPSPAVPVPGAGGGKK